MSFVLLRLGAALGAVGELEKQMAEHQRYCGEILQELRLRGMLLWGCNTRGMQVWMGCSVLLREGLWHRGSRS